MVANRSKFNSLLSLEYMVSERENITFDRKSALSKPASLADDISAFANAEGGTLVIGICNNGELEGINSLSNEKLNDLIEAPRTACKPMPQYDVEFFPIMNKSGAEDRLLLIHIKATKNNLIRTAKDDTYLRVGDRSVLMKGENLRQLEYQKQLQKYEDEICPFASLEDLDETLINEYKTRIGADDLPTAQVLTARGLMRQGKLTNAAVLLFAKNIRQFYQNCRVRFIRYEGQTAKQGLKLNIVKDQTFEEPIFRLIDKFKAFLSTQLRDFTTLNPTTGKFETSPEYPEFAWQEGVINAITHREYAHSDYIRVIMYDDRLVIESPGKLPYPVTTKNIRNTRASRNPMMARVLTEMGWVRELNEGVKRIYAELSEYFLQPPSYKEDSESGMLRLVLYNNMMVRHARFKDSALRHVGIDAWKQLDDLEKSIITYMAHVTKVRTSDLVTHTGYASNTIQRRISHLMELGIIDCSGRLRAPQRYYYLKVFGAMDNTQLP